MNIAITAEIMDDTEPTGCQYYTYHLIQALLRTDRHRFTIIGSERTPFHLFDGSGRFIRHKPIRIGGTAFFSSILHPLRGLDQYDLVHCPSVIAPFFSKPKSPLVMTVYDMTPILFPEYHKFTRTLYFKHFLRFRLSIANKFIAISKSTKKDLEDIFRIPMDRIVTIYPGVDPVFKHSDSSKEDYILCVSTLEPRKNFERIIQSYISIKEKNNISTRLVIVGRSGWKYDTIFKVPSEYKDHIEFTGYVNRKRLVELYQKALVFLYPSLYEGFGLPVLEAMACGCPVITSSTSSLPEAGGDAAVYVNPYDAGEIERAVLALLRDEDARRELSARGLARAREFTWKRTAEEVLDVYESLA